MTDFFMAHGVLLIRRRRISRAVIALGNAVKRQALVMGFNLTPLR